MARQPNIVFFMTDQLRRDVLGCYGNSLCKTPNLDLVAAKGVCFENAFTVSPVCSPARASLLTGLYPHNHGVMLNTHIAPAWSPGLSPKLPTFSRILNDAGYVLDYVGKWHVHKELQPEHFGFARALADTSLRGAMPLPAASRRGRSPADGSGGPRPELVAGSGIAVDFSYGARQLIAGTTSATPEDTRLMQRTRTGLELIRERAAGSQPFMVRMDMPEPHFPCLPPEPYASMYDPDDIPPWDNFEDDFAGKPPGHLRKLHEWNLADKDWAWWSRVVAKYYGVVTQIDDCVGEVLSVLGELGIADETIFVFCTDHGDAMGSHGHFEKAGTMYDEIFRVPLLMTGPKPWVEENRVSEFVRSLDLMPTFVEWGGAQPPEGIDGKSIAPLARGEGVADWPDAVYCEHHGEVWGYQSQRMVRTTRWKYVFDPHSIDELYDLANDPGELVNRIADPACETVREEMKARLLGWNDATNDMFQWLWVRWNFPEPIPPGAAGPTHS